MRRSSKEARQAELQPQAKKQLRHDHGARVTVADCDSRGRDHPDAYDSVSQPGIFSARASGGRGRGVVRHCVAGRPQPLSRRECAGTGRCARVRARRIASSGSRVLSAGQPLVHRPLALRIEDLFLEGSVHFEGGVYFLEQVDLLFALPLV